MNFILKKKKISIRFIGSKNISLDPMNVVKSYVRLYHIRIS